MQRTAPESAWRLVWSVRARALGRAVYGVRSNDNVESPAARILTPRTLEGCPPYCITGLIQLGNTPIILLPGLDGTGKLFSRFVATAPRHMLLTPVALPAAPLTYDELADGIAANLPNEPVVVIAESFSGPLAVALAERHPVTALVFCNSFIVPPRWRALRWLALPILFKLPVPCFLLRRYMLGATADDTLVREVATAVASVPAALLASRLRYALSLDEAIAFASCTVPMLYVRGTEDRLVPESAWRRMVMTRPMRTARVSGPHLLLQANPAGAWKAIAPFLDSLPAV
jgi:pimeloyl-[acyl-carrier protein] methyl ester esterase